MYNPYSYELIKFQHREEEEKARRERLVSHAVRAARRHRKTSLWVWARSADKQTDLRTVSSIGH